jgi:hypothetical protein
MPKQPKAPSPRRGRRALPAGTAVRSNTTLSTSQRVRDALIAISERENRSIANVVLEAVREKYPNDFNGI